MTDCPRLTVIDLAEEIATLDRESPSRIVGVANEDCLRLSVFEGQGSWHRHRSTDEMFLVLDGELKLDVERGDTAVVGPRQVVTVPAGVVHRPRAEVRSVILCFKPSVSETDFYDGDAGADAGPRMTV